LAKLELRTRCGTLAIVGWREPTMRAAAELVLERAHAAPRGIERIAFGDGWAFLKHDSLRGKARVRWTLKRWLLRARAPRVQEYYNLCWLCERLFSTPLPLAAGVCSRRGAPHFQFLLTQAVDDAPTLEQFLKSADASARASVLEELAREVARMHALGFVHHDLYPRNILVRAPGDLGRVTFLDAWAGGPPPQLRGAAYDLACFFLRGPEQLSEAETRVFLESYARFRRAQARPVELERLTLDVRAARARLVRRLQQRPHELRGERLPALEW
jgi:tRNA A-37 threonylcarbamoyl transferase component Bud32